MIKKLYIIVQYDFINGGYLQYAIDDLVFKSKELAESYRKIKPNFDSTGVEELFLYPDE